MWLVKMLGSVTCAHKGAPGSRASSKSNRSLNRNLTETSVPQGVPRFDGGEAKGKITVP